MNHERTILEDLQSALPRMLTETVLRADMQLELGEMSLTDLRSHLKNLERKRQVVITRTEDNTRIKITPDGIARLAE